MRLKGLTPVWQAKPTIALRGLNTQVNPFELLRQFIGEHPQPERGRYR